MYRTKQHFVEDGLAAALTERSLPGAPRRLSASDEARLVAVALDPLAGEVVGLTTHATLSGATVGRRLAELKLKPWHEKMWCIPTVSADYKARMDDVLALYAMPSRPTRSDPWCASMKHPGT